MATHDHEYNPECCYDHRRPTTFTRPELEEAVGWKATLPLTGRFVEVREGDAGPYIMFEVDQRWGLAPGTRLGFDMEAFYHVDPT